MGRAIRAVTTERGYDLAEFALFAFGGAGPLHAIDVAEECAIPIVVVPQEPGTMCARGMLLTDTTFDFVRSLIAVAGWSSWDQVQGLFATMRGEAERWLVRERVAELDRSYRCHVDARYEGQNFEVTVPVPAVGEQRLQQFLETFATEHRREYGYDLAKKPVEIVNCRMQAVGAVPKAPLSELAVGGALHEALCARRSVYFGGRFGWVDTPVYLRSRIAAGSALEGPALIEEMSSTVAIAPRRRAEIDRIGNIVVHVREKG